MVRLVVKANRAWAFPRRHTAIDQTFVVGGQAQSQQMSDVNARKKLAAPATPALLDAPATAYQHRGDRGRCHRTLRRCVGCRARCTTNNAQNTAPVRKLSHKADVAWQEGELDCDWILDGLGVERCHQQIADGSRGQRHWRAPRAPSRSRGEGRTAGGRDT